jgi:hypothetical protein
VPVCLYWRSHGMSPGEPSAYLDHLAVEVYGQVQQLGWDAVSQLRTLALTRDQAEGLLARLQWITGYVERVRREQQTPQE